MQAVAAAIPRGRAERVITLPEPELYKRAALCISDAHGNQYIAERCPVALSASDGRPCHIVRRGHCTKNGVVAPGFPVAMDGVQKLICETHKRNFHMLHPLVHEDLPATVIVQPELVVLTEGLVLLREAYEELAIQVCLLVRLVSHLSCQAILAVVFQKGWKLLISIYM